MAVTGVVKWFDDTKGYGFISPDDDSTVVFVHKNFLHESGYAKLEEGQKVEFEPVEGVRGPNAMKVVVV